MSAQGDIRVLVALHGRVDPTAAARLVDRPGMSVAGVISSDAEWAARGTSGADALVIACSDIVDQVLDLVGQAAAAQRGMPVIVACAGDPNGRLHEVFEAGADDIVVTPDLDTASAQVGFAIEKSLTRRVAPAPRPDGEGGQLICILGPKGGTGKTLTASNLATALALEGARVALVDLDLQFGDLGLVLGLAPERSVFDLVTSGGTLDGQKLDAFMAHHQSGAHVLLAPTRPDQASAVTTTFLGELYPVLRAQYDFVIVDTPPGFTAEVIATIDAASSICLIGMLDAPSLKNAKLGAETLELMGYPMDRVRVVLNRADSNVGVSHADVVTILGRAPDVLVPSTRDIVRSVNAGEPVVMAHPRSEAAKAFQALAKMYLRSAESRSPIPHGAQRRRGLKLARS
jgi:pilus assembly protein CpaE